MRLRLIIVYYFVWITQLHAQDPISLEKIWNGYFKTKTIAAPYAMQDGKHYTLLEEKGITKYNYKTKAKKELVKGVFTSYTFSLNENYLLLETQSKPIYRRSKKGIYEIVSLKSNKHLKVFHDQWVQEPLFSPDEKKLAFVYKNDLYVQEIETGKTIRITYDGVENKVINGICDWVYEEEMAFTRAFNWSADSKKLAYLRFDQTTVAEQPFLSYNQQIHPVISKIRYPKAGESNSEVSVYYYSLDSALREKVNLRAYKEYYLPKMLFTKNPDELALVISNREQNQMDLLIVNTQNHDIKKILSEKSESYLETDRIELDFLEDGSFIWSSERSGFRQLYHYSKDGKKVQPITNGDWEVTAYYGYDPLKKSVYYQSTEEGSLNLTVSSTKLDGRNARKLSREKGANRAWFSKKFDYFINKHSKVGEPPVYSIYKTENSKLLYILEDNKELKQKLQMTSLGAVEFKSIPATSADTLDAWMIKPKNFDKTKKYPLLVYVYGGPGSKIITNEWGGLNYLWFEMLSQKDYLIAAVDNRGTARKGVNFKKITYKNLGKYELEDQIKAAEYFKTLPYIDSERIGIFGWSFGGYLSCLAMTKSAGVFKAGVAVAPVTHWRFYNSIYTERYMGLPQENEKNYEENSPLNFAKNLKGNLLILHGTLDDNVHFQNSLEMSRALIKAKKSFDFIAYPDKDHSIQGAATRYHLYDKMTRFILEKL